jgi:hypothetical protein
VNQSEWAEHARKWRDSLDSGSNTYQGSDVFRFADGSRFEPDIAAYQEEQLRTFLRKHFSLSILDQI